MKINELQRKVKVKEKKSAAIRVLKDDLITASQKIENLKTSNKAVADALNAVSEERDKYRKHINAYQEEPLKYLVIRGGELAALRLSSKETEGKEYKAFLFGKTVDVSTDIKMKQIL